MRATRQFTLIGMVLSCRRRDGDDHALHGHLSGFELVSASGIGERRSAFSLWSVRPAARPSARARRHPDVFNFAERVSGWLRPWALPRSDDAKMSRPRRFREIGGLSSHPLNLHPSILGCGASPACAVCDSRLSLCPRGLRGCAHPRVEWRTAGREIRVIAATVYASLEPHMACCARPSQADLLGSINLPRTDALRGIFYLSGRRTSHGNATATALVARNGLSRHYSA